MAYKDKKTTNTIATPPKSSSSATDNVNGIKIEKSSCNISSRSGVSDSITCSASNSNPNVFIDLTGDDPFLVNTATQQRSLLLPSSATNISTLRPSNFVSSTQAVPPHPSVTPTVNNSTNITQSSTKVSKSKSKRKSITPSASKQRPKRALSVYNLFMRDDLKKVKAANPSMPHKEAFKMSVANWNIYKQQQQLQQKR